MAANEFPRWPNIEHVLMHWAAATFEDLGPLWTSGHVGREYPDQFEGLFFRPRRWPTGGRTKINDYPVVDLEVLGADYDEVEALIESMDTALLGYPLSIATPTGVVVLDHVEQTRAPVDIPFFGDSSVVRFQATYQLSLRR